MNVKKEHIIVTLMPIALTPEARLPVLTCKLGYVADDDVCKGEDSHSKSLFY